MKNNPSSKSFHNNPASPHEGASAKVVPIVQGPLPVNEAGSNPDSSPSTLDGEEFTTPEGSTFKICAGGVFLQETKRGEVRLTLVCGPLKIIGRAYSRDDQGWGRLLRWHDPDGREHEWFMPMGLLEGPAQKIRRRLASGGLYLGSPQRSRLIEYLRYAEDAHEGFQRASSGQGTQGVGVPCLSVAEIGTFAGREGRAFLASLEVGAGAISARLPEARTFENAGRVPPLRWLTM